MQYVSLLRGINVGGHKRIKMADLKELYSSLGFEEIVTYIQSGNVVFTANKQDQDLLITSIEKAIYQRYGFEVSVQVREKNVFAEAIKRCPYSGSMLVDETQVLLCFLSSIPSQEACLELQKYVKSPEQLVIDKDVVYLYCPNSYSNSKLGNNFIEKKLQVKATTRNWKSVCALQALMIA
ncbi:hypothetical protein COB21_04190 [Candidatus Aerophobetes bacterium]|uniref:DUF1697 domain-containing protein n=1 Tax=Aerophobetes bacterium TaxID=2030807 RepID=A0A2A4X284_UNCAE|nr:MAG: hypothetical protein COB21_04190 [Candidatus Aerophobetes bacterium]